MRVYWDEATVVITSSNLPICIPSIFIFRIAINFPTKLFLFLAFFTTQLFSSLPLIKSFPLPISLLLHTHSVNFCSSSFSPNLAMAATDLKSLAIIDQLKGFLDTDEGLQVRKKINLVYQFNIAPKKIGFEEVIYTIDLKKGEVTQGAYEGGKADAIFSIKDDDFVKLALGKMNPQIAFMRLGLWFRYQLFSLYSSFVH
ncbi:Sterol carrier protein 2 [Linum perenne]